MTLGRKAKPGRTLFVLALLGLCTGCETVSYYAQAVGGQLSLLSKRQSIDALLQQPNIDAQLAEKLATVQKIRAFAVQSLALPVGKSYASYVDLQRDEAQNYVVWNVFAAPELSLEGRSWCYPVIGCAKYRGYFSHEAALSYAEQLQRQGMDTFVAGVSAYSTLGWLNDPILSTFVRQPDNALASLLFHELAHKVLYIADDTEFNESFATAVAEEGLERWLSLNEREYELEQYREKVAQRDRLLNLIDRYRAKLASVYSDPTLSETDKRQQKNALFAELQEAGSELSEAAYKDYLLRLTNNASLVPLRSYHRWVSAFQSLLDANATNNGSDLSGFYQQVIDLSELPAEERHEHLQNLTDSPSVDMPESVNGR